jgi:RNA polymerase sigma factor (TIGR02999 family)
MAPDPMASSGGARRSEETRALCAVGTLDPGQIARLFELVYGELRRLAARCLDGERAGHTLQPTALVHEAYLELVGHGDVPVKDKHRFLAIAAQAMRRTLIDHARGRGRVKRGGGWQRVELDPGVSPVADEPLDLERLDGALEALRAHSEDLARLVELRFFAGLPMSTVAEVLGMSERSAGREWSFARAWLQRWLKEHGDGGA